eukprot:2385935-Alexandrium_andersonii.AAC.1
MVGARSSSVPDRARALGLALLAELSRPHVSSSAFRDSGALARFDLIGGGRARSMRHPRPASTQ